MAIHGMAKRRLGFFFQLCMELPCMRLVSHYYFLDECSLICKMMIIPFLPFHKTILKIQKKKKEVYTLIAYQYWFFNQHSV